MKNVKYYAIAILAGISIGLHTPNIQAVWFHEPMLSAGDVSIMIDTFQKLWNATIMPRMVSLYRYLFYSMPGQGNENSNRGGQNQLPTENAFSLFMKRLDTLKLSNKMSNINQNADSIRSPSRQKQFFIDNLAKIGVSITQQTLQGKRGFTLTSLYKNPQTLYPMQRHSQSSH
jgi:hypothetical protein